MVLRSRYTVEVWHGARGVSGVKVGPESARVHCAQRDVQRGQLK